MIGLIPAVLLAAALALQPDRAMAGALAVGLGAVMAPAYT